METFLDALNELIASSENISPAELIGAIEITKQSLILELLSSDEEEGE